MQCSYVVEYSLARKHESRLVADYPHHCDCQRYRGTGRQGVLPTARILRRLTPRAQSPISSQESKQSTKKDPVKPRSTPCMMKFSALLLLLVSAIAASVVPSAYGLEDGAKGVHLRHLQDQPDQPGQPQQPEYPNTNEQPQQPGMPNTNEQPNVASMILSGLMNTGGNTNTNPTPGSNEILVGGCFPGSWNWPGCRVGCFPGSWNWPRCRFGGGGGGGGCFPGSWGWPRCRSCFPGSWGWPGCRTW